MTDEHLDDGSIENADDFGAVIAEAVEQAVRSDVDVRGVWQVTTGGSCHHWEVEIVELAPDHGDD